MKLKESEPANWKGGGTACDVVHPVVETLFDCHVHLTTSAPSCKTRFPTLKPLLEMASG